MNIKRLEQVFNIKAKMHPLCHPSDGFTITFDKEDIMRIITYESMSPPSKFELLEVRGLMETAYFRRGGRI